MNRADWYPEPGKYLAAVRKGDAITAAGGKVKTFWACPDLDAAGWQAEKLAALDRRINLKGGIGGTGRRWDSDYQRHLRLDACALADNLQRRVIVHQWNTDIMRKRFTHLLSDWRD